jgi:D-sedoheptulose 7-phosphate isomerase
MQSFAAAYLTDSAAAAGALAADTAAHATLQSMATLILAAFAAGNRLLLAGNGGSAADCAHLAAEFQSRCHLDSAPLPAINLAGEAAALTAFANDYGVAEIFARQIRALGRPGDVFLALSTSGNSPNILAALDAAGARGLTRLGFTGQTGGAMAPRCDHVLRAPSPRAQIVQQLHITAGHALLGLIEHDRAGAQP